MSEQPPARRGRRGRTGRWSSDLTPGDYLTGTSYTVDAQVHPAPSPSPASPAPAPSPAAGPSPQDGPVPAPGPGPDRQAESSSPAPDWVRRIERMLAANQSVSDRVQAREHQIRWLRWILIAVVGIPTVMALIDSMSALGE